MEVVAEVVGDPCFCPARPSLGPPLGAAGSGVSSPPPPALMSLAAPALQPLKG